MNIPLQQTREWQKLQDELGETTFFEETNEYTFLAIKKTTKLGNYLFLPYGPYANTEKSAIKALEALQSLAKREKAMFIRIEPQAPETASYWANLKNAKKSKDLSPRETWVLDLDQPRETIISNFTQGTRTCFNQFPKKGISVSTSKNPDDIHFLTDLQKQVANKRNFSSFSENYLKLELAQKFATLYLANFDKSKMEIQPDWLQGLNDKKIIAASLFFDHGDTRYYMQSASDYDYHRLPASVAILSTAIFDAKKKGLKYFDFWGIAPENAPKNHPWAGFTKFKKSFGGRQIDYCGTYDIVLNKKSYKAYKISRKINRIARKALNK